MVLVVHFSGDPYHLVDAFGAHPLYFKLGYFSLIGLLRIHGLRGDYKQAVKTVENIEFGPTVCSADIHSWQSAKTLIDRWLCSGSLQHGPFVSGHSPLLRRFRANDDAQLSGGDSLFRRLSAVHPADAQRSPRAATEELAI